MTPNLPPVLPGFSEPIRGRLKTTAGTKEQAKDIAILDLSGTNWVVGAIGDAVDAWYSLRLVSAIARANGIGGEEIPDGLPPLPTVPDGFHRWEYRGKGYDSSAPCVYAGFFEQFPDKGWRVIPDDPDPLRGNVDAHYIEAVRDYKFRTVSCSQCGNDFGPGDHGFSHCADHSKKQSESPKPEAWKGILDKFEKDYHAAEPTPTKPEGKSQTPISDQAAGLAGKCPQQAKVVSYKTAATLELRLGTALSDLAAARADLKESQDHFHEFKMDAEVTIQRFRAALEWTPISKGLPNIGEEVLGTCLIDGDWIFPVIGTYRGRKTEGDAIALEVSDDDFHPCDHWRKIPLPPSPEAALEGRGEQP